MLIFLYVSHLYIYIYIYIFKFLKENNANEQYEILIFFQLAVRGSDLTQSCRQMADAQIHSCACPEWV